MLNIMNAWQFHQSRIIVNTGASVGKTIYLAMVPATEDRQCTMGLSIALRIFKITQSKGPDFAQF